jgi:tight adherence protein B
MIDNIRKLSIKNRHPKFVLFSCLIAFVFVLFSPNAFAFSKKDMDHVKCSEGKLQLLYYYLEVNRDASINDFKLKCGNKTQEIKIPAWIDTVLPEMHAKTIWRDPVEGQLSEAVLWQTPISILYEFFTITRKTFPSDDGGQNISPLLLAKEYTDIRVRFQMSIDRVYRSRLMDSMEGRGRVLLGNMDLILGEMESLSDAITNSDIKGAEKSIIAISFFSQDLFSSMFQSADGQTLAKPGHDISGLIKIIGILFVFFSVWLFLKKRSDFFDQIIAEQTKRVKSWTEVFGRQFLKVKVEYLILAPMILFVLMGMATLSFPGFLLFTVAGVYIGLKMPSWVLGFLKERRGKKIDNQLIDGLILLSNSLKSGMDIVQGFELVSRDLLPPISEEFGLVIKNYQLGTPFERALAGMEERVSSRLLSYMIRAINLQRQVGGNITKVFERIVENIREESKLEEKTKALTAQQKIQSIVVGIMPWILVGMMVIFQGKVMIDFYSKPLGMIILMFCVIWIGIGMKLVRGMGKIQV